MASVQPTPHLRPGGSHASASAGSRFNDLERDRGRAETGQRRYRRLIAEGSLGEPHAAPVGSVASLQSPTPTIRRHAASFRAPTPRPSRLHLTHICSAPTARYLRQTPLRPTAPHRHQPKGRRTRFEAPIRAAVAIPRTRAEPETLWHLGLVILTLRDSPGRRPTASRTFRVSSPYVRAAVSS